MAPILPFHAGELAVQTRAGEAETARMRQGALGDRIPGSSIAFIARQPMVVVASIGEDASVWASVLLGEPGFLQAEGAQTVCLDTTAPRAAIDDPLWQNLRGDPRVGLLIIELGSRRRLRINGRVRSATDARLTIEVETAYPNCPKYIQRRHWRMPAEAAKGGAAATRHGSVLTPEQQTWIGQADTLFVASADPRQGPDASHRGGKPGFVQIPGPRTLRIPDYAGNSMFNTLGNFATFPHAGLAFVDFERGRLLQLIGRPLIRWDHPDPRGRTGGTGRFWELEIEAWRESDLALRLEWEFLDYSPFIPEQQPVTDGLAQ